ncbi:MAG: EF-hand domain-containing protein [Pirellulaceae bacterium]
MKKVSIFSSAALAMMIAGTAMAQPGGFRPGGQQGRGQRMGSPQEMISQLFDAADKDGDGKVTKQELTAAMTGMAQTQGRGPGGFGRGQGGPGDAEGRGAEGRRPGGAEGRRAGGAEGRGPGGAEGRGPGGAEGRGRGGEGRGPGGPGGAEGRGPGGGEGRGPGGPGGLGMGGPRPEPGELLPAFMIEELGLNERQQKRVMALQADVKKKLDSILTEEQKEMLAAHHDRAEHGAGHGEGERRPGGERGGRGQRQDGGAERPSRPSRSE